MTRYKVTGEYVTAPTGAAALLVPQRPGVRVAVMGFSRGARLPEDVPQEHVEHLLRKGLIEAVEEE